MPVMEQYLSVHCPSCLSRLLNLYGKSHFYQYIVVCYSRDSFSIYFTLLKLLIEKTSIDLVNSSFNVFDTLKKLNSLKKLFVNY